ncbi:hypothetical protein LTR62_000067 [Meristemomyces frigidus]|uniref:DUF1275 domain protein n=1 Tax=Meristemomyces frigidus TaxID=1508187 RepID=A0AAN7YSV2_9PEZI|nr:hypothetical protein LTR62_000067 [Meristemomyces frigidus]
MPHRGNDQGQEDALLSTPTRHYESFAGHPNGAKQSQSNNMQSWADYLNTNIATRHTDLILIVCFAVSGLIDSGAYNAYTCFMSMQPSNNSPHKTGNTVFAALGVSNLPQTQPRHAWTKSVASIIAYLLGALFFANFHRAAGQTKRWVFAFSFLLQAIVTTGAAILVGSRSVSGSPVSPPGILTALPKDPGFPWADLIPIALLAFQASGKVCASRMVGFNALPTVVLTTLYSDFMGDPKLFFGLTANPMRNRRLMGVLFYFGGAVAAGQLVKSNVGFAGLLYIAAAVKLVVVIAWVLWPAEKAENDESSES